MEFFRRHSVFVTSFVLIVSASLLTRQSASNPELASSGVNVVSKVLTPFHRLNHSLQNSFGSFWQKYIWLQDVQEQKDLFQKRVAELEKENARLTEFEKENQRLRSILDFKTETEYKGLVAKVIAADVSNWSKTIKIDKGSADGLKPGLAVVDGHAVVGQVIQVNAGSAIVLLLTDSSSAIDVLVQSNRISGIVEGTGTEVLKLNYIMKLRENSLRPGDKLITSGVDGIYPKGLFIGVVTEVSTSNKGMFKDISVNPKAQLWRLENVMVIMPPDEQEENA